MFVGGLMEWKGTLAMALGLDRSAAGKSLQMLASSAPSVGPSAVGAGGGGHQVERDVG